MLAAATVWAFASAAWGDPDTYEWTRLRHKPAAISDLSAIAEQPSHFMKQAVELSGCVSGILRSEVLTTLLFKLDSGQIVHLLARPEHEVTPTGAHARAIARLAEPGGDVYTFNLLAMTSAPAAEGQPAPPEAYAQPASQQFVAPPQPQEQPAQPRYVLPSRGGPSLMSEARILYAYQRAIAYFNPRLSEKERCTIARYIIDFSRRIGVDARLVMAVVAAESNFNASATSRTGAMGLGQLMPATARGLGVRNAYDARDNLWGAIRLVRGHLENNDGDIALALACYNAGSGAVRRYGGVPPYRETRNYIRKVTDIYLQLAPEMAQ